MLLWVHLWSHPPRTQSGLPWYPTLQGQKTHLVKDIPSETELFPVRLCKRRCEPSAVPVALLRAVISHREKEGAEGNNHFSKKCVWGFYSARHRSCQLGVCWRKAATKHRAGQGRAKLTRRKANLNFSCCKFGGRNAVPSFLPRHSHTQNNLKLVVKKINCRERPWRALAANCSR